MKHIGRVSVGFDSSTGSDSCSSFMHFDLAYILRQSSAVGVMHAPLTIFSDPIGNVLSVSSIFSSQYLARLDGMTRAVTASSSSSRRPPPASFSGWLPVSSRINPPSFSSFAAPRPHPIACRCPLKPDEGAELYFLVILTCQRQRVSLSPARHCRDMGVPVDAPWSPVSIFDCLCKSCQVRGISSMLTLLPFKCLV